jgi:hypothetical protein
MKVTDEMVEAACESYCGGFWPAYSDEARADIGLFMRRAINAALRVQAMEQLIEAGAEQMEQEERK